MPKLQDTQLGILKIYMFSENSAEGLRSRRERYWRYIVYVFENTPKNLVVQGRVQLEHSSHIVSSVSKVHANISSPILKETIELAGPFGAMLQEHWHSGKVVKPNCTDPLKCRKVHIIKQLEHGRTSTTEEQKWFSFLTIYD